MHVQANRQGGRANQTLRPVTIKQIREAKQPHPDADWQIDGVDVSHVSWVSLLQLTATDSLHRLGAQHGDDSDQRDVRDW